MISLITLAGVTAGALISTAVAAHAVQRWPGNQRIRDNPGHYVAVEAAGIAVEQARLQGQLAPLRADLNGREQQLAQVPSPARPSRLLLKGVCLSYLAVAFGLSASQLIPSFHALTGAPWIVDVLLGLLTAAAEIGAALLLAHHLRPEGGWSPLAAKVGAAVAVSFALLVMVAQLIWAPAHDVLPGRAQIAAAQEQLAEDKQSGAPPTVIATDRQQIAVLTGRLDQAQTRDQGLALMVTLGSDLAAWEAIGALGYLAVARRRRRLHHQVTALQGQIRTVEQAHNQVPLRVTHRVQRKLQRLGIDPALATAPPPHAGNGTTAPPHAGNGTTAPPHAGNGTTAPPHAGNGTTAPPHAGNGTTAPPHAGNGTTAPPHAGNGTTAPPHAGNGTTAPPHAGNGTTAPPHAGNGTTAPPPPRPGTAAGGGGEPNQQADPGTPPGGRPLTPDDLFGPPQPADDGRWTDPLF